MRRLALTIFVMSFAVSSVVFGETVEVKHIGQPRGGLGLSYTLTNPNQPGSTVAGPYRFELRNPSPVDTYGVMNSRNGGAITPIVGSNPPTVVRDLFCYQLTQTTSGSFLTYEINLPEVGPNPDSPFAPIGAAKGELLARLYGRFHDTATGMSDSIVLAASGMQVLKTAFQLAVWEIVHETTTVTAATAWNSALYNVASGANAGSFYVTLGQSLAIDQAIAQANVWLAGLKHAGARADGLYALLTPNELGDGSGNQDYLIWTGGEGFGEEIPAPGALVGLIGLVGCIGFQAARRRLGR
jgi:hypothetical protein